MDPAAGVLQIDVTVDRSNGDQAAAAEHPDVAVDRGATHRCLRAPDGDIGIDAVEHERQPRRNHYLVVGSVGGVASPAADPDLVATTVDIDGDVIVLVGDDSDHITIPHANLDRSGVVVDEEPVIRTNRKRGVCLYHGRECQDSRANGKHEFSLWLARGSHEAGRLPHEHEFLSHRCCQVVLQITVGRVRGDGFLCLFDGPVDYGQVSL